MKIAVVIAEYNHYIENSAFLHLITRDMWMDVTPEEYETWQLFVKFKNEKRTNDDWFVLLRQYSMNDADQNYFDLTLQDIRARHANEIETARVKKATEASRKAAKAHKAAESAARKVAFEVEKQRKNDLVKLATLAKMYPDEIKKVIS